MITLKIDGIEVQGEANESILDVATRYGIEIPTLCHSEKIKEFGACGLCVVEASNSPKLLRACATAIGEGMDINTGTERVIRARTTALELLMSDHDGDCIAPCQQECPAETDCQAYVGLIANGQYADSLRIIKNKLPLPASIGRVCPHPCETGCRRKHFENPVSIAQLKYFVADIDLNGDSYMPEILADSGKKVAIIGGGPAGLSASYFLRQKGHAVTILDMMPYMGGMLRYGIPQYRLPKEEILQKEIDLIAKMGVEMKNNVKIPTDFTLESLQKDYDAVLVAVGAWVSAPMRVQGEDTGNVFGGIDFLRSVIMQKPFAIGKNVAVCGGGNTAMDACRTAIRLGAENVYIVYRRTKNEMPADLIEIEEAEEEGVTFKYLTNPSEIISKDGKVTAIKLQKMALGEPDASGRRSPVALDEYETLDVDSVIMALGQKSDLAGFEALSVTRGTIDADENRYTTNIPGVFAAGDVTNTGAGIAIAAIAEAKKAANAIGAYLEGAELEFKAPVLSKRVVNSRDDLQPVEEIQRAKMPHLSPADRRTNFSEVNHGYTEEQAKCEASRCLECGCLDYYECKLVNYANKYNIDMERLAGKGHSRREPNTHPYIIRNEDKCILCGQCVRICSEVVGKSALGFVGRGFDTIVKPAMAEPLEETDCISCGQCVSVCPTGALIERQAMTKPVPLEETCTRTTCGGCAAGCQMNVKTHGQLVLRALPTAKAESFGDGLLCKRGRFEFMEQYKFNRITKPIIGGKETDFDTALATAKAKLTGGNAAVIIGATMTCETIDKALELAKAIGAEAYYTDGEPNEPFWLDGVKLGGANVKYLQDKGVAAFSAVAAKAAFVIGTKLPESLKADFVCAGALYDDCVEADVILPTAAFLEENGTFVNYNGVVGTVNAAIKPVSGYTNAQLIEKLI